jgi:hypothetical protein
MTVIPNPPEVPAALAALRQLPGVILYIGPDQIMPLTSILGAIVGVALMFWNRLVGLVQKFLAMLTRRTDTSHKASAE